MYIVNRGEIQADILYMVNGEQSVLYNAVTYTTKQQFRGISGLKIFVYTGSGSQEVNEVIELKGCSIEFDENAIDLNSASDVTFLEGTAIEYALNNDEMPVNDLTKIQGFALELIDYPFYSFEIIETRL